MYIAERGASTLGSRTTQYLVMWMHIVTELLTAVKSSQRHSTQIWIQVKESQNKSHGPPAPLTEITYSGDITVFCTVAMPQNDGLMSQVAGELITKKKFKKFSKNTDFEEQNILNKFCI